MTAYTKSRENVHRCEVKVVVDGLYFPFTLSTGS